MKEKIRHGVILAGGRSQRFGSDKALVLYKGVLLIRHALNLARLAGLQACVVTQENKDYSFLGCPVYFDRGSFRGPLAGLERAFEVFPDEKILVLTCDMPFLTEEDIRCLIEKNRKSANIVLYKLHADRFQPFPGLYSPYLATSSFFYGAKNGSMQEFIKSAGPILEIEPRGPISRFSNINYPEDLPGAEYDVSHNRL